MTQQLNEKQSSSFATIDSKFFIESILFGIASSIRTNPRDLIAILIFTSWTLIAPQANAQPAIEDIAAESITIQALIDGRSILHLQGNTAQWFHIDAAAPGRHPDDDGNKRIEPTVINGVEWFPVWPDEPDLQNRDCMCFSDVFEGVVPSLTSTASDFNLEMIQVRQVAFIAQHPAAENDFTLTIMFDDNSAGGSFDYIVELTFSDTFKINAGLNDAWYDPETDGQGFFVTVFPDLGAVSIAWFTYDTELPPMDATANLGDAGHRWMTAAGLYTGNQAVMNIVMTSDGLFDTATDVQRTDPPGSDGTLILTFDSCNSGTVEYDIPSIDMKGIVPIQRVAGDNIALCEALSADGKSPQL